MEVVGMDRDKEGNKLILLDHNMMTNRLKDIIDNEKININSIEVKYVHDFIKKMNKYVHNVLIIPIVIFDVIDEFINNIEEEFRYNVIIISEGDSTEWMKGNSFGHLTVIDHININDENSKIIETLNHHINMDTIK